MPSIAFYTLGCRSNQYETDVMAKEASSLGLEIVPYRSSADIYVVNTCTVTGNAGRKSRNYIRQAKKMNPKAKVIATGCDVEIDDLPEADLILPNKDKSKLSSYLKSLFSSNSFRSSSSSSSSNSSRSSSSSSSSSSSYSFPVRANLMIEDGCENFCSYCIVPLVRGKVRSRPVSEIIDDAKEMVKGGVKEIVLTGINLGEFSLEPETEVSVPNNTSEPRIHSQVPPLVSLISKLSEIEGLLRIRLSSIEPQYVTKELIETIRSNPKVCHHLHIPLQSGDDGVLKAMKRKYTAKGFNDLVSGIRRKIKDISITTDIIVGFPGETEKAFKNTMKIAKALKFARIHIFSYSDRPGTAASELPGKVGPRTIAKRRERLLALREKNMLEFDRKFIKRPVEVLIESGKNGMYEGLTNNYIRIRTADASSVGELARVKLRASDIIRT